MLADSGYDSGKNLDHLEQRKIDVYIPSQDAVVKAKERRGEIPPRPFTKDKFRYNSDSDYYECPNGEKLLPVEKRITTLKTYVRNEIVYKGQTCHQCSFQKDCVKSKSGYRQVKRFIEYDPLRESIDKKLASDDGKRTLKHRSMDVEPTFGQIKQTILRRNPFLVRGQTKSKGEFGLICIAHNIKKIFSHLKSDRNEKTLANLSEISMKLAA